MSHDVLRDRRRSNRSETQGEEGRGFGLSPRRARWVPYGLGVVKHVGPSATSGGVQAATATPRRKEFRRLMAIGVRFLNAL